MNLYKNKTKIEYCSEFLIDHNQFGCCTKETFFDCNDVYLHKYDKFGNNIKTTFTDGDGEDYYYMHDKFGNCIKESFSNSNICLYEYDKFGNRIKETTPNGDVYNYTFDNCGNYIQASYPDGTYKRVIQMVRTIINCSRSFF